MISLRQWLSVLGATQLVALTGSVSPALADSSGGDGTSSQTTVVESSQSTSTSQSGSTSSRSSSQPEVFTDTINTPDGITIKKIFRPKFQARLNDLRDQIELGVSKGWLTAEQAGDFKQERDRVSALEAEVRGKGYQKADVDKLEQQVTALNDALSQALVKGSTPPQAKEGASDSATTPGAAPPVAPDLSTAVPATKSAPGATPESPARSSAKKEPLPNAKPKAVSKPAKSGPVRTKSASTKLRH